MADIFFQCTSLKNVECSERNILYCKFKKKLCLFLKKNYSSGLNL